MEMRPEGKFADLLREKRYRATPGRVALLAALARERRPASAESIARKVAKHLDAANVYRALESFSREGIVRRVDVGHQHMHYELAALLPHHHHYVCADCGARQPHA